MTVIFDMRCGRASVNPTGSGDRQCWRLQSVL